MARDKCIREVVIVYDREHTRHPFIVIAIKTLVDAGFKVSIIDADGPPEGASYAGSDAFTFRHMVEAWEHTRAAAEERMADRAFQAARRAKKIARRLDKSPPRWIWDWLWLKANWSVSRVAAQLLVRLRRAVRLWFIIRRMVLDEGRRQWRGTAAVLGAKADAIIGIRPASAMAAWLAARRHGARFVYFPFELYGEQAAKYARLIAFGEKLMLRFGVDALITQNEARAAVYVNERGFRGQPAIVHNYKPSRPEVAPEGRLRSALGIPAGCRIVLYEGLLVQGRWLDRLIRAADFLPEDTRLVFVGEQKRWWRDTAPAHIAACRRPSQIVVGDYIPHDQLLQYVADADAGIIIYDDAVRNNRLCEPGKLSDYVLAGVPVVAPAFPTIAPIIRQHGIGTIFESSEPAAIAAAIRAVLDAGRDHWLPTLQSARRELIWETQAPRLISAVAGVPVETREPKTRLTVVADVGP